MIKPVGVTVLGAAAFFLAACAEPNCFYPPPPGLLETDTPRVEFSRGPGYGPVTITMPNGETLYGGYQIAPDASYPIGSAQAQSFSPVELPRVRQIVMSVRSRRGTILDCKGAIGVCGNGSAVCRTPRGEEYRVAF